MANNIMLYYCFVESVVVAFAESVAALVVSTVVGAGAIAAESVTVVVESVVASVLVVPLLQATKKAETAKTKNNFFMLFNFLRFFEINYKLIPGLKKGNPFGKNFFQDLFWVTFPSFKY
ncbi:MAG TPA: hypothetical protein VGW31_11430 [Hanamia sp.]|nr:hypothetical protein [Hanamia sp.]